MKRKSLKTVLFAIVAALLLMSIMITTMLGSVRAQYSKSFSKTMDFEMTPDMNFRYKVKDADGVREGVYADTINISQQLKLTSGAPGSSAIYEIEIPLSSIGLHTVDFTVDFANAANSDFFVEKTSLESGWTESLNNPVGCKLYSDSGFSNKVTRLIYDTADVQTDTGEIHAREPYNTTRTYDVNKNFQWKTLAPSRSENVTLSVNATTTKVYLRWDLRGLTVADTYTISLTNIKVTKIEKPEGPYMDFANMYYTNNALFPTASFSSGNGIVAKTDDPLEFTVQTKHSVVGKNEAGKTRQSMARGTYVTEATYNSMTMQAEKLAFGYDNDNETNSIITREYMEGNQGRFPKATWDAYSNILSFGIPIKNVEVETTYKVTFDLSLARQGGDDYNGTYGAVGNYTDVENLTNEGNATYASHENILTNDHFECYLYRGGKNRFESGYPNLDEESGAFKKSVTYNVLGAVDAEYGRGQVMLNDKGLFRKFTTDPDRQRDAFKGQALLSLKQSVTKKNADGSYTYASTGSINDANYYNMVLSTENNGENIINWITYKNLTFSFNLDEDWNHQDNEIKDNLALVWAIDALEAKSWYRIKMENVRIEEVVQYGSNITGLSFNGTAATLNGYADTNYRGSNGTGQNYTCRQVDGNLDLPLAAMNVYAPAFDAIGSVVSNSNGQKINLTGIATCKGGGVAKYVWSADGGETWYDVSLADLEEANATLLKELEGKAENSVKGNKTIDTIKEFEDGGYVCEYADFTGDTLHTTFDITVDLVGTPYENQPNLDIIFAAVPLANMALRCEIFKIYNYNAMPNYRTYTLEIESDIEVMTARNKLNANYLGEGDACESIIPFTELHSVNCKNENATAGGYAYRASYSHKYEDIRALFYDFPVKTTLKIRGWAIVEGGVDGYYWSADYGKTWNECGGTHTNTCAWATTSTISAHRAAWYDGSESSLNDTLKQNCAFDSRDESGGITADLSAYVGTTIDVIFGAKSNDGGPLCPVGRIDNVAVYGDGSNETNPDDRGTFFTRLRSIYLGNTNAGSGIAEATQVYPDAEYLTYLDRWDLGYASDFSTGDGTSYTIFEPYNVDVTQTRKFVKTPLSIVNEGTLYLDGYVYCPGGVERYQYSLNGGKDWYDITDTVANGNSDTLTEAQRSDASFVQSDGNNGNFMSNYLEVKLPKLSSGTVDLLVVAESNSGKLYPVLHQTINISDVNGKLHSEKVSPSNVTLTTSIMNLSSTSYTLNYSAIPEIPITKGTYCASTSDKGSTISVPKSTFAVGEKIPVDYFVASEDVDTTLVWIAISRSNESDYIKGDGYWAEVSTSTQGTVNLITNGLTPGEYKLWLIDGLTWASGKNIVEPITIFVTNLHSGREGSFISVPNGIFAVGEDIPVEYFVASNDDKNVDENNKKGDVWIAISPYDGSEYLGKQNEGWFYVSNSTPGTVNLKTSNLDPEVYKPGLYKLWLIDGGDWKHRNENKIVDPIVIKVVETTDNQRFAGSSMSVPKTYFLKGESIPVTYSTIGSSGGAPWIAISTTDDSFYIKFENVANGVSNERINVRGFTGIPESTEYQEKGQDYLELPPGEYRLWLIDGGEWRNRYDNLMTEPISIKIIDPDSADPDKANSSYTHIDNTKTEAYIKLAKTVFKQGEDISFTAPKAASNEWVAILGSDWTWHRSGYWSYAAGSEKKDIPTSGLEPGQYRLFYLSGSNIPSGTVYAIIDIIILPSDASQTLTVEYTNSAGSATTETPEFDVGEFNVTKDLNVKAGTTVKITAEYKNFGAITGVNRFEPKS